MSKIGFSCLLVVFDRLFDVIREEKSPQSQPPCPTQSITPSLHASVAETSRMKPLNPDATPWLPDFRFSRLPKAKIMYFDGNPLNYHLFMKTFENSVEKYTDDDNMRLQLLIQYCTGKLKETIRSCRMMNGRDGYLKAKKLLEERFGEKYDVSNKLS